jgi:hypothetical protein
MGELLLLDEGHSFIDITEKRVWIRLKEQAQLLTHADSAL